MVNPRVPDTGAIRLGMVEEENGALGLETLTKNARSRAEQSPGLVVIKSHKRQLFLIEWVLQLCAPVLPVVLCRIFLGMKKL